MSKLSRDVERLVSGHLSSSATPSRLPDGGLPVGLVAHASSVDGSCPSVLFPSLTGHLKRSLQESAVHDVSSGPAPTDSHVSGGAWCSSSACRVPMSATFPVLPTSVGLKLGGSAVRAIRRNRPTFGGLVPPPLLVRPLCPLGLTLMASVRVCSAGIFIRSVAIGVIRAPLHTPAMSSTVMLARVRWSWHWRLMLMGHLEVWTVYEMAAWGRGLASPCPFLGAPAGSKGRLNILGLGAGGLGIPLPFSSVPCWVFQPLRRLCSWVALAPSSDWPR